MTVENKKKDRRGVNIALALLIAIGLWFYVINVENPTGPANLRGVPVQVVGESTLAEADLMVTDLSHETMDLKLTGRKKTLMKLDKKNVSLAVDVSSITQAGSYDLPAKTVFPSHVNTDNVSVSSWDEMEVTVTVAEKGTKTIPVRGEFIGTAAAGYLAGTVTTDPETIELTGPQTSLDQIVYAAVQVGGESVGQTIVQQAPVVFMDRSGQPVEALENITASASQAEITVPVRKVARVPLTVSFRDGGGAKAEDVSYTITPEYVSVVVTEDTELPESISLGEIDLAEVYADGAWAMPIRIPRNLTGWGSPGYASVTVELEDLVTRQITTGNITLINVPQGMEPSLVSQKLHVWVRGPESQVAKLSGADLAVVVDLTGARRNTELQRFPAEVSFVDEELKNVGIVGSSYSAAVRFAQ